jgi:hypothetical protein
MHHWYVYYKLPRAERDATLARVRRVQAQLAQATGVRMRLLERTGEAETTTVMEVYEDIGEPERFGAALDAALRAHCPDAHVAARRIERFEDA